MNNLNTYLRKNLHSLSKTSIKFLCSIILVVFTTSVIAQNSEWMNYTPSNSQLPSTAVISILGGENDAWLGTDNGVAYFNGTEWDVKQMENSGLPDNYINDIAREENGTMWFATDKGLVKLYRDEWAVFNYLNSGLPINVIRCIAIDSHGTKWIGTWGAGLVKLEGSTWTLYNTANSQLPHNGINSISIDANDKVWVGTFNGGMAVIADNRWSIFNVQNSLLRSNNVKSIGFDRYHNTWVCTTNGIVKINGKVWTNISPSVTNFNFQAVNDVVCGKNIWFASDHGLMEFDGDSWKNYRVDNSGILSNDIRSIGMDEHNNIWLGTAGKGLVIYNPAGVALSIENTLTSTGAINIFPNPAKGEVTFSFTAEQAGKAELELYDMLGKKVCTLLNEEVGAGKHELKYNTNILPTGVYIWRIRLRDRVGTMRLAVI